MSGIPLLPRPTVILPDTTPLILLAAGNALAVLTDMGPVVVVDIVALEATHYQDKPYAKEIAAWLEAGQATGSNRPVAIVESELGPLYRLALAQGLKKPRHSGEIAIAQWLEDELASIGGPALVVYEDGAVPLMLARQGLAAEVAATTTRNLLTLAQELGYVADAEAIWSQIVEAVPTANPASVFTRIKPTKS